MTDEMMAVRDELYFAIGNCCTQVMLCEMNQKDTEMKNAKNIGYFMCQFGVRAKLISPNEGNDLLALLKENGSGCANVFEKHGQLEQSASSLASMAGGRAHRDKPEVDGDE